MCHVVDKDVIVQKGSSTAEISDSIISPTMEINTIISSTMEIITFPQNERTVRDSNFQIRVPWKVRTQATQTCLSLHETLISTKRMMATITLWMDYYIDTR